MGSDTHKSLGTLVLFIAPGCSLCEQLLPAVRSLVKREKQQFELLLVSGNGDHELNFEYAKRFDIDPRQYVVSPKLSARLGISITPYALLIDTDRHVVTKRLTNNREQLESLRNVARYPEKQLIASYAESGDKDYGNAQQRQTSASSPVVLEEDQ